MSKVVDFKEQKKNYKADCSTVSYIRIKDIKKKQMKIKFEKFYEGKKFKVFPLFFIIKTHNDE